MPVGIERAALAARFHHGNQLDLGEHRFRVEPEFGQRAHRRGSGSERVQWTERPTCRVVVDGVDIGGRKPEERRRDEQPLRDHQPLGRTSCAAKNGSTDKRADSDTQKNQRQQQ
jgi:hypothetical protein